MSRKIVLLDGGLGQEVHKRSGQPAHPMWSVEVMKRNPDLVEQVHRDFINAGARVITVNSYPLTPTRLKRDSAIDEFEPLQRKAVELARNAARDFPDVQIAGCLPPLVGSYTTDERSEHSLEEEYNDIVRIQKDDVDLFVAETIPSFKEARAAVRAAKATRKPVLLSFNLADESSTNIRSGESVSDIMDDIQTINPDSILFNCSFPEYITSAIESIKDKTELPFGGYANGFTSVKPLSPGGTVDALSKREDLTEEQYARTAMQWIMSHGASIVGGCCEVGPSYIERLRQSLEEKGYDIVSFQGLHE